MYDEAELKTQVLFKDHARQELLKGITVVGEAVGCTLGPRGRTVIIQQPGMAPLVTKDGVTVAKAIKLKDPIEGLGADLVKQAAERTNDIAGDGTTTATVLTHAMVSDGNKMLGNGSNSVDICRGIDVAVDSIIANLKKQAKPVVAASEIAQVATISANGDTNIGGLVAEAMEKVGRDGIITVEDAKGMNTSLEVVEGLQFDRGYLSPYFVTNTDKMTAVYEGCRILIVDKKVTDFTQLVPVLELVMRSQQKLLIIAEDIEGTALQTLVLNRVKGNLPVVAIKSPGYGQHRDELLGDLCTLTGATLVSDKTGVKLDKLTGQELGLCKKIIVDAKATTLVAGDHTSTQVKEKVEQLRARLDDVTLSQDDVIKLKSRVAALAAGVAVVKVGGATELEMVERKHRIEDALHATRAAAEEGIVAGGGAALLQAAKDVDLSNLAGDVLAGAQLVVKACEAPLRRIVINAGGSPDVVINKARETGLVGYDAVTETFKDMFVAGIIDPVKVTRTALQHAASVTRTFLTLDAVVYTPNEEKNNAG
jgi:chaperonin GroEL